MMNWIKQEFWLGLCWGIKTLRLRPQAWFDEHRSRVRHARDLARQGAFDYAAYGRRLLAENKTPDKTYFVNYVEHGAEVERRSGGGQGSGDSSRIKLIAFYLPQFHAFKENDEWHGRGFTEWTNVTRAMPQFIGHHQPQLPIDVGFYDLSTPKVMYRQVELAKQYGIHGFCFHYYWFTGRKRLLERPIFNWLEHKELDLPFMLCWANENWSKLWDGGNREVLMRQESRVEDAGDFFRDILPFLQDERYIRIDGKPHLIIYNPKLFDKEKMLAFLAELRRLAQEAGLGGLFVSMVGHDYFEGTAKDWGFDAMVEFPPMRIAAKREYADVVTNPDCKTLVYDMGKALADDRLIDIPDEGVPVFRGIFPGWDNTARKAYSNASCYLLSPELYGDWLRRLIAWERQHNAPDKRFVFVNAWNEWAEGAHLEPDAHFGYAYLTATMAELTHA